VRLNLSEEAVMRAKDVFEILFPNRRAQIAARLLIEELKRNRGWISKAQLRALADRLEKGEAAFEGRLVRYSKRNFYLTVVRRLVELGFIDRNKPRWSEERRRTIYGYGVEVFKIPKRPPSSGFWRISYYVCKKWNELLEA